MKKTRILFILKGNPSDVNLVLGNLNFKGLTELSLPNVTADDVFREFKNNKSIVCSNLPTELERIAIKINVINSTHPDNTIENCINVFQGCIPQQFLAIANAFNCDIGDHKSNSSGLNGAPSALDCPYCRYIDKPSFDKNFNFNRTVYQSNNFIVIPTVGEFIKGYLLIIPLEHVMSMAELSQDLQDEFLTVLDDVTQILKLTYPIDKVFVWENGTGNGGIGKAKDSIVHSHIHIAPSQLTTKKVKELSGFPLTKILYEDLHLYSRHSYLLIKDDSATEWWINNNPDLYIPRQYIRQLIAEEYELCGDSWNWRTNPFIYLVKSTCRDIQNALICNWSSLPERIKQNTSNFLFY